MTTLAGKMASVLAPYLGGHSADAVAHHICAKYATDAKTDREKLDGLCDFLRRGLVAYVGFREGTGDSKTLHPDQSGEHPLQPQLSGG